MPKFYSNGKLLITGEYVVLDGAKAFALPTKFGQSLSVDTGSNHQIEWTSFDSDRSIWFQENITFQSIIEKQNFGENHKIKNTLIEILHEANKLNPKFLEGAEGYKIITELTFPRFWGLGTSSTLINNIAQFLEINAFELLKNSFGGSGYDVACAQHNTPIEYQLIDGVQKVKPVLFEPNFKDKIYFVYLNQKQNSKAAIASYFNKQSNLEKVIPVIDALTQKIIQAETHPIFASTLELHEIEMSTVLESPTVKESLFNDFDGTIKSLGAWGGDFVMVVSENNPTQYFKSKGYNVVLTFKEMIL